jgi:AcrR family transcriptional regulator
MPPTPPALERRSKRGRPAIIDREMIVAAALSIASEDGASAVTMSSVSRRLGVGMPALYHYIRNVSELLEVVATALLADIAPPDGRLRWDRWLRAFADEFRSMLRREPLLTRIPSLSVHQPFPAQTIDRGLKALVRGGFDELTAMVVFGEFVRKVVDLVYAEHAREEQMIVGQSPLRVLRARAEGVSAGEISTLMAVLEALAKVPEDVEGVSDVLWEWNLQVELLGLRALLDDSGQRIRL